jgi:protein-arginine kinase activator protein McsA
MLCESCHKAEATCHVSTIVDGISRSNDLCSECYEVSSPEAKKFATAQREARCEYCVGQPCAGGTDTFALMMGIQKLKFMCMPCFMEHNRYIQRKLRSDASGLSQEEQLALIQKINGDADIYMKQWVLDKGSR